MPAGSAVHFFFTKSHISHTDSAKTDNDRKTMAVTVVADKLLLVVQLASQLVVFITISAGGGGGGEPKINKKNR